MPGSSKHPGGLEAAPAPATVPAEFAAQFTASARVFWLIAAGVIGDASLADDIVQEAALIALGKLDQFRPGTDFIAWMGQIVRYVALNKARTERKRRGLSLDPAIVEQPATPSHPPADAGELDLAARGELPENQDYFDDRVMAALAGVGEVARACLLLRVVEGLKYSEIAGLLEIPEGTAMSHVHRTCQHLRERLAGLWSETAGRRQRA